MNLRAAIAALLLATSPALAKGSGGLQPKEPTCAMPALGEKEVKKIIEKERATRTDLPKAFPTPQWVVRREGCHYIAIESPVPPTLDMSRVFTLNQNGVIVDVTIGNSLVSDLKCPDETLTEAQLARLVVDARAARKDLPPPFLQSRIRIARARCTYLYFEYRLPEARGDFQVFTIDPLGELMNHQTSHPY